METLEKKLGYAFENRQLLEEALNHSSYANEHRGGLGSNERLEFLGDSILGAIVAYAAVHKYPDLDEGGLTRIKVALVSGSSLAAVAESLGFAELIVFGSSETGTGHRGMHSALENVYEAVVAALYLDGGREVAERFVTDTLIPRMDISMAREPENPKSALQEKLQEDGITPTYELVDTQGPPHDRTFVAEVFAGETGLARGTGRTKKEAESQAAKSALARLGEFLGALAGTDEQKAAAKEQKAASKAQKAAAKAERQAQRKADAAERKAAKGAAADKVQ